MTTEATPGALGSNDQLGPNALIYARERVSLLGAGEHCATIEMALNSLDGLPVAALVGGWTFKGFTAWAQRLETHIALLRAREERLANEVARLRADLISCRGTVKTEVNHFERLAMVNGKTPHGETYEAEAQRLSALLDRIDGLVA